MTGKKYSTTFKYGRVRLCKRADSGIWYAKFKNPKSGKYIERTTGTTNKIQATEEVEELNSQLHNNKLGLPDGSIPLKTLTKTFFKDAVDHMKEKSIKRLVSSVRMFSGWLGKAHPKVIKTGDVTANMIREYMKFRVDKGVSKRTVNNDVTNLNTIFKWAVREQLLAKSPADYSKGARVSRYRIPRKKVDVYTTEQYEALLQEAGKVRDWLIRDLIIVFAGTGARFQEISHLSKESLVWEAEIPLVEIRAVDVGTMNEWSPKHFNEVKSIPMNPSVQEVLKRRSKSLDGLLFTNEAGNRIADNKTLERLKRLFHNAGVVEKQRLHWHSWRRYFVKTCVECGIPLNVIMSWTGHDTVQMCLEYARPEQDSQFREFRKLLQGARVPCPPKNLGEIWGS